MTKKLTKVAMTTALAAAAIVPAVVATPAQAAEAEVTFAKAYYTTANGTAAFEAGKLAGVIGATSNTKITYVEGSNGEVFPMSAFSGYLAVNPTATTDQVLTALSNAGKALSADQVKALNVKEGKVEGGKVTVDADAPVADVKVESVKAINNTTVEVTFDKEVTEAATADFVFDNGLAVSKAEVKASNKKVVVLTTTAQKADTTYNLNYKGENTGKSFVGVAAELKATSAKALNLRQVEVTFNQEVNKATAELLANYTLSGGISLVANQAKAELQADGKTVVITIDNRAKAAGTQEFTNNRDYRVTVEGVTSTAGKTVQKATLDFTAVDTTLPQAIGVSTLPGSNAEIHVKFSEPVDPGNLGNYSVRNAQTLITGVKAAISTVDPSVVVLTTTNGFPVGTLNVSYDGAAKDFAGLQALPVNLGDVTTEGQTEATKLAEVTAQDENTVLVKFNQPVAVPAETEFYWNRTGVHTDNIPANQGSNVTRVDSYTLKVEFNGSNRLPKGEEVYVFAGAGIKDTTGNAITGVNTQQFKVTAPAAAKATLAAARAVQDSSIIVTFDKVMNGTDLVDKAKYTILDSEGKVVTGTGLDSLGHPTATITPDASGLQATISGLKLKAGNYTVKVTDIKDGNDNKISAEKQVTVADTVEPTVQFVQATDEVTADYDAVYVYFSKAMDPSSLVNTENYLFNTGTEGLVKLSDNPAFISITPMDGNKAVQIKFDKSAKVEGAAYKIAKVKDLAGNESPAITATAVAVTKTAKLGLKNATNVKRVDGKTTTFELDRHLSYVEKSDFKVGKTGAFATDAKAPASVKFENKYDSAANRAYTVVTVVSEDTFNLTDAVTIKNVATTPVSKDALGNPFAATSGTNLINLTAGTPVAAKPEIKSVYVTAANKIVVEFNKAVTGSAADFEVFDPSSATPNAAITPTGSVTNGTTLTLDLGSNLASTDATPTVKVKSLVSTQDSEGVKIAGGTTHTAANFHATNVRLVDGDGNAVISNGDKVELTFNKAIDAKTFVTDVDGAGTAWNGNTDINLDGTVSTIAFKNNVVSDRDALVINVRGTDVATIDLGSANVVTTDQIAGNATLALSSDRTTITVSFNSSTGFNTANINEFNITNAKYTPVNTIKSVEGYLVNNTVAPTTVTNFGGDPVGGAAAAAALLAAAQTAVTNYEALDLTSDTNIGTALASKAGTKEGATAAIAALPVADQAAFNARVTTKDNAIDTAATVAIVTITPVALNQAASGATASLQVTAKNASNVTLTTGLTYSWSIADVVNTVGTTTELTTMAGLSSATAANPTLTTTAAVDSGDGFVVSVSVTGQKGGAVSKTENVVAP